MSLAMRSRRQSPGRTERAPDSGGADPICNGLPEQTPKRDDTMNSTDPDRKPDIDAAETGDSAANSAQDAPPEAERARYEQLYDRFTERARELFDAGQEKSKEAMEKAMETAREQLAAAEEFSAERGEAFKAFMRRDLDQTAQEMRELGQEARDRLNPSRLGAGALSSMARLLDVTGAALQNLSRKAEDALHYNTGEITAAGTLTCTRCGQKVHLKRSSHIPPCPGCHGTQFRKSY